MPSAQIEAAVGIVRHQVFVSDGEVLKLLVRDQVRAVVTFINGVLQDALFHRPRIVPLRIAQMPALRVRAIEDRTKTIVRGAGDRKSCNNEREGKE